MSDFFQVGTFSVAECPPFAGIVKDERVVAIHALTAFRGENTLDLLQNWAQNFPLLRAAVADPGFVALPSLPLENVYVHAPILYPRQIFCAGANYRQHVIDLIIDQNKSPETEHMTAEERRAWGAQMMDKRAQHGIPYVFTKIPSTISGQFDEVIIPKDAEQPDWELELVVVIGKAARRVSRADALDYVAGYTLANDLTNREKVHRADMKAIGSDWLAGKCSPGYLPMGPFITPAAFIPDPHQLHLTLKLNGETMQDQRADDMIFNIPRLIEYTSHLAQLWPGDVLLTGSPKGNGTHYEKLWARAEALNALVFIHPLGSSLGERINPHYLANLIGQPIETTIALSKIILDGVLDRYPALKILAAHGGGYLPSYNGRTDHGYAVRPEIARLQHPPSEYLKRIYFDNLIYIPEAIKSLIEDVSAIWPTSEWTITRNFTSSAY